MSFGISERDVNNIVQTANQKQSIEFQNMVAENKKKIEKMDIRIEGGIILTMQYMNKQIVELINKVNRLEEKLK